MIISILMKNIDYPTLLKLRLFVGRYGEMDMAKWWNTQGMLGPYGARVLSRGIPRTHSFAQARVVFVVAKNRCDQIFFEKECYTLWRLPAEIEDQFEDTWQDFLEQDGWQDMFQKLEQIGKDTALEDLLTSNELIDIGQMQEMKSLKITNGQPSFSLGPVETFSTETLKRLAAGFTHSTPAHLVIPYVQFK